MIRIQQLKLPITHTQRELERKVQRELGLRRDETVSIKIRKRSIDARKKPELYFNYVIDCHAADEEKLLKRINKKHIISVSEKAYQFPACGKEALQDRPVVVGAGPGGLFCALLLAEHGYRPILLEQGMDVDSRIQDVERFWKEGLLQKRSNVQFGEGGAGTFSDGKLNTLVKDKDGRNGEVLRRFVEAGADPSILYENKPHIGTDVLVRVVKNLRREIERLGGSVRFQTQVTGFLQERGQLTGLLTDKGETLPCSVAVFAIGHSARDTFQMLYDNGLTMEAKEFAAGFRVEHRQKDINLAQYGMEDAHPLQAASYKLTAQTKCGRGVYSFCMCPGGYVVNASSEEGRLAVNGMSYSGRDGVNSNSAIIVSVRKSDFASEHPLSGIAFQRSLEEAAYQAGGGRIPVQRLGELRRRFWQLQEENKPIEPDNKKPPLEPMTKGAYAYADLTKILPHEMTQAFLEGMEQFSHVIAGFGDDETLVSAVESRTSSPVRIVRDKSFQSNINGIYPCGEGAGYAGGITSAAMDGIRIAEAIAVKYRPLKETIEA